MSCNHPNTTKPSDDKPAILARDILGAEHLLFVDARCDLVVVEDDAMTRVLHPAAAIELALALIHATRGHYRGIVGPISGGF